MFASFLIGLREGLEASLIIGILVAYLVRMGRRDLLKHVWIGVAIALGVSLAVGAFLTLGQRELDEEVEEILGGTLSLVAVGLVTWMVFWLARTARTMRASLEGAVDKALLAGGAAVLAVAFVSVGREGIETSLFIWAGINAAGTTAQPLIGAVLGIGLAVVIGFLIARGALRVNLRLFFRWTGVFLIVVAAGVLAYAIHELQEAHVLPGEDAIAYDMSGAMPSDSWYGTLLRGVFNFRGVASVLEVVGYWTYVIVTLGLYLRATVHRVAATPAPERAPVASGSRS